MPTHLWLALVFVSCAPSLRASVPLRGDALDERVEALRVKGRVPGLALAIIEDGQVAALRTYGVRDVESQAPLTLDTVMYAASFTKFVFATLVQTLVEEGRVELDRPLAQYLPKPLPEYGKYADLAGDPRWQRLTARMILEHASGFPNFRSLNDDGKLDIKVDPGSRYAYSGEGINLLQFVLEQGLGLDVGVRLHQRFAELGMTRSGLVWRDEFGPDVTTGYTVDGVAEAHHQRGSVRAAGSLDTSIRDFATFLAAFMRGEGLSNASRDELLRPQLAITSAHQFPTFAPGTDPSLGLSAGLGVVLFSGPQGRGFFKGGHDDWTDNTLVCLEMRRRCVVLLSNSARAQAIYPAVVRAVLGETGLPWRWEYSDPSSPPPID